MVKGSGSGSYVNNTIDGKSSISLDVTRSIFPLNMCLDSDGRILCCSEQLDIVLGTSVVGEVLFDIFEIQGPAARIHIDRVIQSEDIGKLLLLSSTEMGVGLRGQFIEVMYDSEYVYQLIASPWLSWLYENVPDPSISVTDFPVVDSQLEYQMNLCASKEMLSDLQAFSAHLEQAREEAEHVSWMKTKIVRHISHEIRTPLNGVTTSLRLLGQEKEGSRRQKLLEIANESAGALMALVNEVLDFSRIEAGVFVSEKESFSLASFMKTIEAGVSVKAAENNMLLRFELCTDTPARVVADKNSLQLILYNLLGNAIKYSGSDQVVTRIDFDSRDKEDLLLVEVQDFGIGIPKQDQAFVFDPFWTASKKSNEYSTGLGLSIVKETLDKLGGSIRLESTEGQGSKFEVTFPVEAQSATVADTESKAVEMPLNVRFQGKLLLVDDNVINLELAQILLKKLGLEVITASDGDDAVATEQKHDFDLILMDIEMPVLKGNDATVQIRKSGRNRDLPIIAMTANVSPDDIELYQSSGMNDSLSKPIKDDALISILSHYLPLDAEPESTAAVEELEQASQAEPILQIETFNSLMNDIGIENARRVIGIYTEQTGQQIGDLVRAMNNDKLERVRSIAHRIASSSLSFGLIRLGSRLREIERVAKKGISFSPTESVELEAVYSQSRAALDRVSPPAQSDK